eukprot:m.175272 g.175272  ORF g.175272 m.175272 type:complete len:541 (-) comp13513_c3_seq1:96-1718(-)
MQRSVSYSSSSNRGIMSLPFPNSSSATTSATTSVLFSDLQQQHHHFTLTPMTNLNATMHKQNRHKEDTYGTSLPGSEVASNHSSTSPHPFLADQRQLGETFPPQQPLPQNFMQTTAHVVASGATEINDSHTPPVSRKRHKRNTSPNTTSRKKAKKARNAKKRSGKLSSVTIATSPASSIDNQMHSMQQQRNQQQHQQHRQQQANWTTAVMNPQPTTFDHMCTQLVPQSSQAIISKNRGTKKNMKNTKKKKKTTIRARIRQSAERSEHPKDPLKQFNRSPVSHFEQTQTNFAQTLFQMHLQTVQRLQQHHADQMRLLQQQQLIEMQQQQQQFKMSMGFNHTTSTASKLQGQFDNSSGQIHSSNDEEENEDDSDIGSDENDGDDIDDDDDDDENLKDIVEYVDDDWSIIDVVDRQPSLSAFIEKESGKASQCETSTTSTTTNYPVSIHASIRSEDTVVGEDHNSCDSVQQLSKLQHTWQSSNNDGQNDDGEEEMQEEEQKQEQQEEDMKEQQQQVQVQQQVQQQGEDEAKEENDSSEDDVVL